MSGVFHERHHPALLAQISHLSKNNVFSERLGQREEVWNIWETDIDSTGFLFFFSLQYGLAHFR